MVSVCIATYNGKDYLKVQLDSILSQLEVNDEIIVSDDCSNDGTRGLLESYCDVRIKLYDGPCLRSPSANFENALKKAKGDFIFLSDQDDIWMPNKIKIMSSYLSQYDVVVSNCLVVDKELQIIKRCFFESIDNTRGFFNNLYDNHYLGCCMAFHRNVLDTILPFPKKISMHDIWIGLCAEAFFHPIFIDDKLIMYRRHGNNASNTSEKSDAPLYRKIGNRLYYVKEIFKLFFRKKLNLYR